MQGGMFAELGLTLRTLRESAGLTQAEAARRSGLGKSQLSKYETGKELPKLASLEKLLRVLDIEPLTLFHFAHLLRHRSETRPIGLMITATPLEDPALASFRLLFGHFLDAFEILMVTRLRGDGAAS